MINFKPQFGNLRHIKICELIAKGNELEKRLKQAEGIKQSVKAIKKNLDNINSEIHKLMQQE